MPVLSRFGGMVFKMYLLGKEHNPPHIHVLCGEYNAVIDLVSVSLVEGDLPARSLSSALEWAGLHRAELLRMWETQQFSLLPPL